MGCLDLQGAAPTLLHAGQGTRNPDPGGATRRHKRAEPRAVLGFRARGGVREEGGGQLHQLHAGRQEESGPIRDGVPVGGEGATAYTHQRRENTRDTGGGYGRAHRGMRGNGGCECAAVGAGGHG